MKSENIEILKRGGVGVIPTDTIYGLVGRADLPETVKRISNLKNRSDGKGFISSLTDLDIFDIKLTNKVKKFLAKYWPGKVSVEFFYDNPKFFHLRRPEGCNAFRSPDKKDLIELLKQTGPLVAPSANLEGEPPAKNITEARKYFGGAVDFYEDGGELNSKPSTLVKIDGDEIKVLRPGAVII
jgi:L-threonylcarbamoyladenylate synthase